MCTRESDILISSVDYVLCVCARVCACAELKIMVCHRTHSKQRIHLLYISSVAANDSQQNCSYLL